MSALKVIPTREEQIFYCKKIARQLGVKVRFKKMKGCSGAYDFELNTIEVNIAIPTNPAGIFFHELGHWYAHKVRKFPLYHGPLPTTKKKWLALCSQALRAERWVDNWGEKQCGIIFPGLRYQKCYISQHDKIYMDKWLDSIARGIKYPPKRSKRASKIYESK